MTQILEKYFVKATTIPTGPNTWSVMNVEVFMKDGEWDVDNEKYKEGYTEKKIGEYKRNYHGMYDTFFPFIKNGKEYALYSKSYSETAVMSLPDCKHVAETKDGFCPVDYFVPDFLDFYYDRNYHQEKLKKAQEEKNQKDIDYHERLLDDNKKMEPLVGTRALVSGCYWGDDSGGWKVMMLDISKIEDGIINIRPDLGYFQLPVIGGKLKDLVQWDEPDRFDIPLTVSYQIEDDNEKSGFLNFSFSNIKLYGGNYYDKYEFKMIEEGENSKKWKTKEQTNGEEKN